MPDPAAREQLRADLRQARADLERAMRDGSPATIRRRQAAVRILSARWEARFATGLARRWQTLPDVEARPE
jgi:hypothetical protein